MKTLLNRKELVAATNGRLSMWAIGEMTRQKKIPTIKLNKRTYLYDYDAVMTFLDDLQTQSMQQAK